MEQRPIAIAERLDKVNPFRVMTVMQRAEELERAGRKIVHMEVGEPDFTTAQPIIDAAKQALDRGLTRYTSAPGIIELRTSLAEHYRARHGVDIATDRILITPGASGGLSLLANLLIDPGDGILVSDPAYPCVRNFIHLMAAEPQLVPVTREQHFQPSLAQLEDHRQANSTGLWLASPANPTGTIVERDVMQTFCQWAAEKKLQLLVDEIYHGLHYVDDMPSVLEISDDAFVVNSFSKYFGMTGWRLGWIVVPESFVERAVVLAQNLFISASSIAQHAAMAAFEPRTLQILEQRRQAFKERRDYLLSALGEMGFILPRQIHGAFYVYADISAFAEDCEAFCQELLDVHGVAVTPGTDFGENNSRQFVRMAFTTSMADLELGMARLKQAVGQ